MEIVRIIKLFKYIHENIGQRFYMNENIIPSILFMMKNKNCLHPNYPNTKNTDLHETTSWKKSYTLSMT